MDQTVEEFINSSNSQGKSKEDIYKELLAKGISIEAIQAGYEIVVKDKDIEDTHQRTINIILTVAALLIGAGIFSFIASNWQGMSSFTKVTTILSSMVCSYLIGWYFKETAKLAKTGESFIFLGTIIYGAGIFLVAQIFNIRANWPDGFLLWMLGTLLMAFAVDSYVLFSFAIPLSLIAIFAYPSSIFGSFHYGPYLMTSSLLLVIVTAATFLTGVIIRNRMPLSSRGK